MHTHTLLNTPHLMLPVILGAALVEAIVRTLFGKSYDWRSYIVSLIDLIGRRLIELLPLAAIANILALAWQYRVATVPLDHWWSWALLFLGEEFFYYWHHRAAHVVRWFWATHCVHHSPNELNFAAAYRLGLTGRLTGSVLFFVPLVWLGFPPALVTAAVGINLLYQFWLHSDFIPKLGWFEWVFNTPSHHRVHHASNIEYLDANYGGILIIFDRLFGTCIEERDDLPCKYGLVHPQTSYNPLRVEFDHWAGLIRDLASARTPRAFFGYLLMPPGWIPEGEGTTTAELRARVADKRAIKEDPPPAAAMQHDDGFAC